ncbi:MAG: hypothetical protein WBG95_16735 [Sulfitobacter sp.]
MQVSTHIPQLDECKFVEVLTAEISGEVIGYCFDGAKPGPDAAVSGDGRLMDALFDRLNALPNLPWQLGRLHLITLDGIECAGLQDIKKCLPVLAFDELVMLPYAPGDDAHDFSVDRAYWAALRLCHQLGMIQTQNRSEDQKSEITLL